MRHRAWQSLRANGCSLCANGYNQLLLPFLVAEPGTGAGASVKGLPSMCVQIVLSQWLAIAKQ